MMHFGFTIEAKSQEPDEHVSHGHGNTEFAVMI